MIVDELRDSVEVVLLGQEIFVLRCRAHHIMADGALRLPKEAIGALKGDSEISEDGDMRNWDKSRKEPLL